MSENRINLTRRDFIKNLGIAAGALAAGPMLLGNAGLALALEPSSDAFVYQVDSYVVMRASALYQSDSSNPLRVSHKNPEIQQLYAEFLGQPLSEESERLLHTTYTSRMGYRN